MEEATLPESQACPLSEKENEKLDLEIESLRKKNRRDVIRLVTTIVAVIGLFFGLYKFYVEQQKDRTARLTDQKLRFQNQLRNDIDEILRFPKDKTVSRVAFLLEDLSTTLDSKLSDGQAISDMFPDYRRNFTRKLVYLISYDSNFIWGRKEVEVADIALEHWKDYGVFLKEDLTKLNSILYNHIRALRYLRDHNPGYFEKMEYDAETDEYIIPPKFEKEDADEERFQHFADIRDGFRAHLSLIADDTRPETKEIRERSRRQFEGALCNTDIAKQIFGADFSDEPCQE